MRARVYVVRTYRRTYRAYLGSWFVAEARTMEELREVLDEVLPRYYNVREYEIVEWKG